MRQENRLLAGKITSTHGLHGSVKFYPYTENLDLFHPGLCLFVRMPDGAEKTCVLASIKPHRRQMALIQVEGVSTLENAEALVGSEVSVDRSLLPETEEDEFYWDELIGLSVRTQAGEILGRLTQVFRTGSNDVYVVKNQKDELLIPALKSVVLNVDISAGLMVVDMPEGLL